MNNILLITLSVLLIGINTHLRGLEEVPWKYLCYTKDNTVSECSSLTSDFIAMGKYKDDQGWHVFDVETNSASSNTKQAYAAGYLEGYIYVNYINYHYTNVYDTFFLKKDFSTELKDYVKEQNAFYRTIAQDRSSKSQQDRDYSETLDLITEQLDGMFDGYVVGYSKIGDQAFPQLSKEQFYTLSNLGDLVDLLPAFPAPDAPEIFKGHDCTGYVRLIGHQMYVSHNTHNLYSMMNRIFKHYHFHITLESGRKINSYKFNSRPGDLNSKDDFYLLNNGMVVIETSLDIDAEGKYNKLKPTTVPKWIRTSIANKLADNNEEWIQLFLKHNSGTHNNQWLIIDYKRFRLGKRTKVLHMVEQTPNIDGRYYEDMSAELFRDGYFASFNAPYFEESKIDLGTPLHKDYFHAKRYDQLVVLNQDVKNVDDIKRVMNYQAPDDLCDTIAARCDLLKENKRPYGGIDIKMTNGEMLERMEAEIIYGIPTIDGQSLPFNWNDWPDMTHHGLEKVSGFDWIKV